jgi:hypothetical protein
MMKQQSAQRAVNEAVADDLNRNPRSRKSFTSEAAIARGASYPYVARRGTAGGAAPSTPGIVSDDPGDLAAIVTG